jgi:hypothetical protein
MTHKTNLNINMNHKRNLIDYEAQKQPHCQYDAQTLPHSQYDMQKQLHSQFDTQNNLTVYMIYKIALRFNQSKVTNTAKTSLPNTITSARVILFRLCSAVVKFCAIERIWEPTAAKGGTGHSNHFVRGS